MPTPINIAIDGYSSTGKSTLARDLAAHLGYRYIDTGAMYRAITLYALQNELVGKQGVSPLLSNHLEDKIKLEFHWNEEKGVLEMYLNGNNVEEEIRDMEVAKYVSDIAAVSAVRRFLVKSQQEMAYHKGVVMDGRDIGTVVLPEAELKIFVTANSATRADRRYRELLGKGKEVTRHEVRANIEQRDLIDTTREDSPLKMADDARLLDNSEIGKEQQLEIVKGWVREALKGSNSKSS